MDGWKISDQLVGIGRVNMGLRAWCSQSILQSEMFVDNLLYFVCGFRS